jgi:hypothetical protein
VARAAVHDPARAGADAEQRALVAAIVPALRQGAVPGYVWREFEAAREGRDPEAERAVDHA